jgi:hypothetical protein
MTSDEEREENYTNDLQALAETYIDKVQIYLLKLLELREIYFTE